MLPEERRYGACQSSGEHCQEVAGIVQVGSVIVVLAALALHESDKELKTWQSLIAILLAILFYKTGSWLDTIVFDPIYGLKPDGLMRQAWRRVALVLFFPVWIIADLLPGTKEMSKAREQATVKLRGAIQGSEFTWTADRDAEKLYGSAHALLQGSEEWENQVQPWLELSKAIRSFVWPLLAVLLFDLYSTQWHALLAERLRDTPSLRWFLHWPLCGISLLLAAVLYVWLRAFHMRAMYKLVGESKFISFEFGSTEGVSRRKFVRVKHLAIGESEAEKQEAKRPLFLLARM